MFSLMMDLRTAVGRLFGGKPQLEPAK